MGSRDDVDDFTSEIMARDVLQEAMVKINE